jgi:hypothetical protein
LAFVTSALSKPSSTLCLTINALKKAGIAMLNEAHDPIFSRKTRNPTRYSGANTSASFDKQVFQLLPNDTDHEMGDVHL